MISHWDYIMFHKSEWNSKSWIILVHLIFSVHMTEVLQLWPVKTYELRKSESIDVT